MGDWRVGELPHSRLQHDATRMHPTCWGEAYSFDACCWGTDRILWSGRRKQTFDDRLGNPSCFGGGLTFETCCAWPRFSAPWLRLAEALLESELERRQPQPPAEAADPAAMQEVPEENRIECLVRGGRAPTLEALASVFALPPPPEAPGAAPPAARDASAEDLAAASELLIRLLPDALDDLRSAGRCPGFARLALLGYALELGNMVATTQEHLRQWPAVLEGVHQVLLAHQLLVAASDTGLLPASPPRLEPLEEQALAAVEAVLLGLPELPRCPPEVAAEASCGWQWPRLVELRRWGGLREGSSSPPVVAPSWSWATSEAPVRRLWEAETVALAAVYGAGRQNFRGQRGSARLLWEAAADYLGSARSLGSSSSSSSSSASQKAQPSAQPLRFPAALPAPGEFFCAAGFRPPLIHGSASEEGFFELAAASYEAWHRECVWRFPQKVPLLLWHNSRCQNANKVISLVSAVALAMASGRGLVFKESDFPCRSVLDGALCAWGMRAAEYQQLLDKVGDNDSMVNAHRSCEELSEQFLGFPSATSGPSFRRVLVLDGSCQYFLPALFRNPDLRPLLDLWFRGADAAASGGFACRGVFRRVASWALGGLAPTLERRARGFGAASGLARGSAGGAKGTKTTSAGGFDEGTAGGPLRVCVQNLKFPQGASWWVRCVEKLAEGRAGVQLFVATLERDFLRRMKQRFGTQNVFVATLEFADMPKDLPEVSRAFLDMLLLGRFCEVAVTTSGSTFGYVGPALHGVPRISGPGYYWDRSTYGGNPGTWNGTANEAAWWDDAPTCGFEPLPGSDQARGYSYEPCGHFLRPTLPRPEDCPRIALEGLPEIPPELLPEHC
mmetsp:Transcript_686/g.1808  ORF Transcript_686/g.1808 Transcript_686/m.1808 type:complete len:845 (-) Transcript_686:101-2635(-)